MSSLNTSTRKKVSKLSRRCGAWHAIVVVRASGSNKAKDFPGNNDLQLAFRIIIELHLCPINVINSSIAPRRTLSPF
jgi:hypothetical protein